MKKTGRPAYTPTDGDRKKVTTMCGMGIPDRDIAVVMGITPPTLRKHFRAELKIGHITATTAVAQSLYRQATDPNKPNVSAAIFWMKCRAGWREHDENAGQVRVDLSGNVTLYMPDNGRGKK